MRTMRSHAPLLARLLAVQVALFGAAVMDAAFAQYSAPDTNQTGVEANPIDTSITTQPSAQFRRGLKAHRATKAKIAHSAAELGSYRRTLTRGANVGVVRNAIGIPVQRTGADVKADVKVSARANADGTLKNTSSAPNCGTDAGGNGFRGKFIPLHTSSGVPLNSRLNTAMNHAVIDGRDMVRPGAGPGVIAGPAKNVMVTIGGASFQPRHP